MGGNRWPALLESRAVGGFASNGNADRLWNDLSDSLNAGEPARLRRCISNARILVSLRLCGATSLREGKGKTGLAAMH